MLRLREFKRSMTAVPVREMTAEEPYRNTATTSLALPLHEGILSTDGTTPPLRI